MKSLHTGLVLSLAAAISLHAQVPQPLPMQIDFEDKAIFSGGNLPQKDFLVYVDPKGQAAPGIKVVEDPTGADNRVLVVAGNGVAHRNRLKIHWEPQEGPVTLSFRARVEGSKDIPGARSLLTVYRFGDWDEGVNLLIPYYEDNDLRAGDGEQVRYYIDDIRVGSGAQ